MSVDYRRWRPDEIAALAEYRRRGLTFGQIARKMPGRSRAAILGYDWRRRNNA